MGMGIDIADIIGLIDQVKLDFRKEFAQAIVQD